LGSSRHGVINPQNTSCIPAVNPAYNCGGIARPRSKSGIFDLTLTKLKRFETGSLDFIY
jgi:hypothetical protein